MKFFGVIEADSNKSFMLHMPILGLGIMDNGKYCMGHITGNLNDLPTLGHISPSVRGDFKEWLNELKVKFPVSSFPDTYEIKVCTYKEACQRALELYGDTMEMKTIGGPTITYDLTPIKNKLKEVIS